MTYKLYTDGGARGNPGPGAIGVVILNNKEEVIYELAKYIGKCTNNEAEYEALETGLDSAVKRKITDLNVYLDSELITKQIKGEYKVKSSSLKKYYTRVKKLESEFNKISFTHVKREKNKKADALVNEALDANGF